IDKNDINNPTLSYGVPMNYRCYQINELVETWRVYPDDNVFHFRVPDWTKSQIDKTTGDLLVKDFPIQSIRQLRQLLFNDNNNFDTAQLLSKIDQGLLAYDNTNNII